MVIRRFVVFRERDFDLGVENGGACDGPRSWYSRSMFGSPGSMRAECCLRPFAIRPGAMFQEDLDDLSLVVSCRPG